MISSILMWVSWIGLTALGTWATFTFDPHKGDFAPQWVSFGYIGLIAVAVAASNARRNQKMADTVTTAFRSGMEVHAKLIETTNRAMIKELTKEMHDIDDAQ